MHDSSWSLFNGGKSLLKFNCLSCFSHSLFSRGFYCQQTERVPVSWRRGQDACSGHQGTHSPALQCQQESSNSFIHKNNFIFLWRGNILSLLLLCLYHFSAGVLDLHAEQRDEAGFSELWRGGQGGWPELSTHKVWRCSQSWSPNLLLATPWRTSSSISLVKTSFIHGASLLTYQTFPIFASLFDRT